MENKIAIKNISKQECAKEILERIDLNYERYDTIEDEDLREYIEGTFEELINYIKKEHLYLSDYTK